MTVTGQRYKGKWTYSFTDHTNVWTLLNYPQMVMLKKHGQPLAMSAQ